MPPLQFSVESAESRSLPVSAQLLQNYFAERQTPGSKSQIALFGAPGLTLFSTLGSGPVRGFQKMGTLLYAVSGDKLFSLSKTGQVVQLGAGISGSAPVSMSTNGVQIIVVNGLAGWTYSTTDGFQTISSPAFYPADTVFFFDGYFVLNRRGTNQFFLSALYDGNTYNGLDFASAEAVPDLCLAGVQNLQLLFVMCADHIELWYDAGTPDFPFQRYAGGVINYGCVAPLSIVKQDGAIFFLGTDKVFYRLQANVPIRISTHPIEHILAKDPDLSTAFGFTHTLEGHKLVYLVLPNSGRTLCFDISTGKWHYRESTGLTGTSLGRWRGNAVVEAYGETLVGDFQTGKVWKLDWNNPTEEGQVIRSVAHSIPYHNDRKRIFISRLELDIQAGVGLSGGADVFGSDPQIWLRWSKDGGQTWSQLQPPRSMGKIGDRQRRLRWLARGQAYQWVFAIECSDPVWRTIIQAHFDMKAGM